MNLHPPGNNLQEKQVQGLQSKRNLHRVYKEDCLTLQLSSIACKGGYKKDWILSKANFDYDGEILEP